MGKYLRSPQGWQLDASQVTTDRVQYWVEGNMTTITLEEARKRIEERHAFVINEQAVGNLQGGYLNS